MKIIPLTKGKTALVDDADYEHLSMFKWAARKTRNEDRWYATRFLSGKRNNGKRARGKTIYMHRTILGAPGGVEVDHINHNGLDNRRSNLRPATRSQNAAHQKLRIIKTSAHRGVSYCKDRGKWRAVIHFHGKYLFLGRFDSEGEAAIAYNTAAKTLFGEFAILNGCTNENDYGPLGN